MKSQLCGEVSGVGGFRVAKIAKVLISSVDHDQCLPAISALVPRNPKEPGGVAFLWARDVLQIHRSRNVPQVGNSIVRPIPVEMVDLLFGPHAVEMQPG